MTRGNQRELARQKNIKKQQEQKKTSGANNKGGNRGLSLEERRHRSFGPRSFSTVYIARDAEQMRLKQLKAQEKEKE